MLLQVSGDVEVFTPLAAPLFKVSDSSFVSLVHYSFINACAVINQVTEDAKITYAFPELRCTFGDRSIVPDIAVFQWNRIPFTADGEVPDN